MAGAGAVGLCSEALAVEDSLRVQARPGRGVTPVAIPLLLLPTPPGRFIPGPRQSRWESLPARGSGATGRQLCLAPLADNSARRQTTLPGARQLCQPQADSECLAARPSGSGPGC